ncbi:MAG: thioredoxin family protein [Aminipila sp.]
MIKTITQDNFISEVEKSNSPVLVELWAPWCVYCRRLSPVLERLSNKLEDQISIGQINVDEHPELAEKLDASTIPALYLYKDGQPGEKIVAPSSQAQLEEWINQQLS